MIYLDHAATTKPSQAAIDAFNRSIGSFGNPSSLHQMGIDAEKEMTFARQSIAGIIGVSPKEIYFTSGGTEANNMAIFGGAKLTRGKRIITTKAEHSSAIEPLKRLADKEGFELYFLNLNTGGGIDIEELEEVLKEPTCLVSIHHVNSETGSVQNIEAIGCALKKASPATMFHVDIAQSFCKLPIDVKKAQIDLAAMSAHKVGGFKGCGALYIREGLSIPPLFYGGGQEGNIRSGTENVAGIAAFGAAALDFWGKHRENFDHTLSLKSAFIGTLEGIGDIQINGGRTSPYILNISIKGIKPEVLLNALSAEGVYISSGSACASNKKQKNAHSSVLMSYGFSKEIAETAVRFSFSPDNTLNEIKEATDKLADCVKFLRRTTRR
ncbi:MAG: cysteine desulfurase [Defluviitaleaceae bacterium]|nr:cysteine desulfurase [Defluviitaleaceae bacterium]